MLTRRRCLAILATTLTAEIAVTDKVIAQDDATAEFSSIIRGQVAKPDSKVGVRGFAPVNDRCLFAAIGSRGNVETEEIYFGEPGEFREPSVDISALSNGTASLHIVLAHQDGVVGDGDIPGEVAGKVGHLGDYLSRIDFDSHDEAVFELVQQSTEDPESDDRMITTRVEIADAQTTIENVFSSSSTSQEAYPIPEGSGIIVEGTTNLQPEDNQITVELIRNNDIIAAGRSGTWGENGEWQVTLDEDLESGTYNLIVNDVVNTVNREVRVQPQGDGASTQEPESLSDPSSSGEGQERDFTTEEVESGEDEDEGLISPAVRDILAIMSATGITLVAIYRYIFGSRDEVSNPEK